MDEELPASRWARSIRHNERDRLTPIPSHGRYVKYHPPLNSRELASGLRGWSALHPAKPASDGFAATASDHRGRRLLVRRH